jgi:hypothetical protein
MNYLAHRAGFRLVEVPIIFPDRARGKSKMSMQIVIEAALRVWKLRYTPVPTHALRDAASLSGREGTSTVQRDMVDVAS